MSEDDLGRGSSPYLARAGLDPAAGPDPARWRCCCATAWRRWSKWRTRRTISTARRMPTRSVADAGHAANAPALAELAQRIRPVAWTREAILAAHQGGAARHGLEAAAGDDAAARPRGAGPRRRRRSTPCWPARARSRRAHASRRRWPRAKSPARPLFARIRWPIRRHRVECKFPELVAHDQVRLRDRRRRLLAGEGHRRRVAGRDSRLPRHPRHQSQARPVHQRRSWNDESVPARRSVRHRGRRRDRPRPRPLRALRRREDGQAQQLHDRPDLRERDPQGTPRRLPRRHRAGDSAHHRRDQGVDHQRRRRGRGRMVEIGGTVGDIESLPFLEAIRQMGITLGRDNVCYIHLTLVPYIADRGRDEDQADPALGQGAARDRHPARHPAVPRRPAAAGRRPAQDRAVHQRRRGSRHSRRSTPTIYKIPAALHAEGSTTSSARSCMLDSPPADLSTWNSLVAALEHRSRGQHRDGRQVRRPHRIVQVAVRSADARRHPHAQQGQHPLHRFREDRARGHGLPRTAWTRSSFPAASASAASKARSRRSATRAKAVPYLGICLGMQLAVVEFARHKAGLADANSTEFDPGTPHPVMALITEWQNRDGSVERRTAASDLGGTMRLGAQPCEVGRARSPTGSTARTTVAERHRHRYEFNNHYLPRLEAAGLAVGAWAKSAISATCARWSSCRRIRGSSAASSTPSSRRIRGAAIRCSSASSARRWSRSGARMARPRRHRRITRRLDLTWS